MADQTRAALSTDTGAVESFYVDPADREVLRSLAGRVAELAARDLEEEKRALWYRLNALEPTRPVVFCDPENGWNEIILPDHLACTGALARGWEMRLRKEIFWGESMCDDRVVESRFTVPYVYAESDWGVRPVRIGGGDGGSYRWEAPIKDLEDLGELRYPTIAVDDGATDRQRNLACEVFDGLLSVELYGSWWWTLGMTWPLVDLRGLEQILFDMVDHPEGLHRLMAFIRDGHLAKLDFLERNGLLSLNTEADYVGSGGFGFTRELPQDDFDGEHVRTRDMWGFCESQETGTVSPSMFEEFVFQYQLPILERFGLNCYGCCEPLDQRWHVVRRAPNLRRVSVSPWADLEAMVGNLEDRYIFSMKPNPADLAAPHFDASRIRADVRRALEITRGCRVEVIMKDNHTIGGDPERVIRWVQIVREEAERSA